MTAVLLLDFYCGNMAASSGTVILSPVDSLELGPSGSPPPDIGPSHPTLPSELSSVSDISVCVAS